MDKTTQMLAYLQQLRSKVAEAEASDDISGSEDDSDEPVMEQRDYHLRESERSVRYTNGDSYTGCMLGDQRHGSGTHTTSSDDIFTGSWHLDKRHGHGTFKAAHGVVYEGSWADDKASGSGRCTYPDGSVYEGEWEADERCGWGTLTTADGQTYEGEWEANQPQGQGQWTFADGVSYFRGSYEAGQRVEGRLVLVDANSRKPMHTYTGRFQNNMRHDLEGVGIEEGLWVYRGSWREDKRGGPGHCRYADGSQYDGEWVRDVRQGSGRLQACDGTTFEGIWQDDKLHGIGKAKFPSGEQYVGHWHQGKRHGHGKWRSAPKAVVKPTRLPAGDANPVDGTHTRGSGSSVSQEVRETYVGSWVADRREGDGVAEYADGGRYEGSWRADKRHGHGLMVFADGVMFRGAWDDDEWLQSAAEPALCRMMNGAGLKAAVAGQQVTFTLQARDELSNPRLTGGDSFRVLLIPAAAATSHAHLTAPALPLPSQQLQPAQLQEVPAAYSTTLQAVATGLKSFPVHCSTVSTASHDGSRSTTTSSSSSGGASVGEDFVPSRAVVEAEAVGDVQDNGDGTYSCSYRHDVAGWYELHVTNGLGEHVGGSPSQVQVLPGERSPRHSSVTGAGRKTATAGCRAEFLVTFKDAFGNPCSQHPYVGVSAGAARTNAEDDGAPAGLEARLVGSNTITPADVVVRARPDGSCSCNYLAPAAAGLYVLEVTAGGRHVGGSPFSIKVHCTPANTQQTLSAAAAARAHESTHASWPLGSAAASANDSCLHATTSHTSSSPKTAGTPGGQGVLDQLRWWGDVARHAYEAIDGSLQGFEDADGSAAAAHEAGTGMTGPEAEMVKANPTLPVVERLEDLWLLSRLQQERKAQEQHKQQATSKTLQQQQQPHQQQPCAPGEQQAMQAQAETSSLQEVQAAKVYDAAPARHSERQQQPAGTADGRSAHHRATDVHTADASAMVAVTTTSATVRASMAYVPAVGADSPVSPAGPSAAGGQCIDMMPAGGSSVNRGALASSVLNQRIEAGGPSGILSSGLYELD